MVNNHDARKGIAIGRLHDFLSTYTPPRGVSDAGQARVINSIADAFVRRVPASLDLDQEMDKIFTKIMDTHKSMTWPTQAHFVEVMPSRDGRKQAPESFKSQDFRGAVQNMMMGAGVDEKYIWDNVAQLRRDGADTETIEKYREANVARAVSVYGDLAQGMWDRKYGGVVLAYFKGK